MTSRKIQLVLINFEATAKQTYDSNADHEKHAYCSCEVYFCLDPKVNCDETLMS